MQTSRLGTLTLISLFLALGPVASAQLSGSVYTTDRHGDAENIFKGKSTVYMAGGPGPNAGCSGNGLPDGTYYFQVTDPSGRVLLSQEPDVADRMVVISGGVISAAEHSVRNGPCGSKVVQLQPFANTPNSSGEYKVWLTPVSDWAGAGVGFHGFLSEFSKTDNFKLRKKGPAAEQTTISGTVFYDINENGIYDSGLAGEVPIPGWKILIDTNGVITETFTDADGTYTFLRDLDATMHELISVAPPPGYVGTVHGRWFATSPTPMLVITDALDVTVDFGKLFFINTPELARSKGYWHNQGRDELLACDPLWRTVVNDLCLRKNVTILDGYTEEETRFTVSETADFDTAFQELSNYLTGNPALGVLAFNLSVQFCASNLNKTCGPLQVTTFIDRFADDVLVSFDAMFADTRGLLCDPRSANTGPHGDQVWRDMITFCLSEWVGMNSGGSNIFTSADGPDRFETPY